MATKNKTYNLISFSINILAIQIIENLKTKSLVVKTSIMINMEI